MRSRFGCARCFGDDARAAADYCSRHLETRHELVDESHFIVRVRQCPACSQLFVTVFQEFVDWEGGNDAQYRNVVPITTTEAADLTQQLDLAYLRSLGADRRYLCVDWPSDAEAKTISWGTGELLIMPA